MITWSTHRFPRSLVRSMLALCTLIGLLIAFTALRSGAQNNAPTTGTTPGNLDSGKPAAAAPAAPAPDPSGVKTGDKASVQDAGGTAFVPPAPDPSDDAKTKADKQKALDEYTAQAKTEPLATKLADSVGHIRIATNTAWTLNTGYLVLFMQAGFALLTCGLIRKKNAGHLMMLNFAAYVLAFIGYYVCGFAFQFGGVAYNAAVAPAILGGTPTLHQWLIPNVLGGTGFFMTGNAYDAGVNTLILFEFVFMETAGYIIVGAICERITFSAFVLCELFIGAILYPIFGCWVWGGGWLSQMGTDAFHNLGHGYVDFAGSTVVHAVGGFAAMALAVILGPRLGKYGPDGKPRAFPAHNLVFVVTGTFILLYGWMGFNPGSTLGATDLRISVVAVNTNIAAIFGSATALIFWNLRYGKPDVTMACNGMLAGLVAITAPCAFVGPTESAIIGILAGLTVCWGVVYNDNKLKIDDPCGAISVHGYCGALGGICVGIFADGRYGQGWNNTGATTYRNTTGDNLLGVTGALHGDWGQLGAQIIGSTVCVTWAFGLTFVVFKVVNSIKSMRVSAEVERQGLDVPEFGAHAYPEDTMTTSED